MTMIVPAGGNRREWVPSDPDKLVKTANVEDGSEVVERDDLLEAAMGVLDNQKQIEAAKDEECCEGCDCDPCECEDDKKEASEDDEVKEAACSECSDSEEIEIVLEEAPVDTFEETPVEEVSEEAEVEVPVEEFVAEAVEEIELVLEEVKDAVGATGDADLSDDAEDTTDFVADEVSDSVVEVEEDASDASDAIDEVDEVEEDCFATANGKFKRLAKVSKEVQGEIRDYWKNDLGYPSDYVDLMFKNYE